MLHLEEELSNKSVLQDGAPPHYNRVVTNFLSEGLTELWIARGGPMQWPQHSPDHIPLGFFGSFYRSCIYSTDAKES
jgi:hypothetical protein